MTSIFKKWGRWLTVFMLAAAVFTGCSVGLDDNNSSNKNTVTNIVITGSTSVAAGSKIRLNASVITSSGGQSYSVKWASKDEKIAAVDENGYVTAGYTGNTSIIASADGVSKEHTVNVGVKVNFVSDTNSELLYSKDLIYRVGDEVSAPSAPDVDTARDDKNFIGWYNGKNKIDSNTNYKIPENLQPEGGILVFTGRWDDTGRQYTVTFKVNGGTWTDTGAESYTVSYGDVIKEPADPTMEGMVFAGWYKNLASSEAYNFDSSVSEDITLSAKWADSIVPVESVSVSPAALELTVGNSATIEAVVLPASATNKAVSWTSSNESVVTVGNSGNVTAVGAGTATVTAVTDDGGKTAVCSVTVALPGKTLSRIEIASDSDSVKVGSSISFTATAYYDDNSSADVTSLTTFSGDSNYVSISGSTVTGKAASDSVAVTGSYEENSVSKTAEKIITVEEDSANFDGIRIFIAKSIGYSLIHYWDCEDKVTYPNTAWPGTDLKSYDSDDYYYDFEGVSYVSFLITKSDKTKLFSGDKDLTEKGDYRVDSSGNVTKISNTEPVITTSEPVITISPSFGTILLDSNITITIESPGVELSSASAVINGSTQSLSSGKNTIAVSSITEAESTAVTVSVTATNAIGTASASASLTTAAAPELTGNFNELRMYQVMVSSFQDGDSSIGYTTAYGPSGALTGGDLQGIINALDYIKSLGCNALWMTPIFNSNGSGPLDSTGYYTYDYFDIDPKFGTKAKFAELVEQCHERGIYVILDGVFGHWGESVKASPSGKTPSRSYGQYKACSFPASLDFFKEVSRYWIEYYQIDGWRLDQCYQVGLGENGNGDGDNCYTGGHNYWYDIRVAVEEAAAANSGWGSLGYMVGEHWNGDASIIQKGSIDPGSAGGYGLRSCFDFPARYSIINSVAKAEGDVGGNSLGSALSYVYKTPSAKGYTHPEGYYPNLFVTNHDLVRLGNLINWKHGETPNSENYWKRHKVTLASIAAYTGPITLYYGDEWGAYVDGYTGPGVLGAYNDNAARSTGKISGFSSNEQDLLDYTAALMRMRAENEVIWNGTASTLSSSGDLYVGQKTLNGETVVFMINGGSSSGEYNVGFAGTDLITGEVTGNSVTVDAYSARFIRKN